ncbi:MAG: hypothetical protein V4681_00115 [Patescibacteria group bacterium]
MPPGDNRSPLEKMQERLYAPKKSASFEVPTLAGNAKPQEPERWQQPLPPPPKKPGLPRSILFLIGAGTFFGIALIVAAALIIFGGRTVSTENVAIGVRGPTTIGSGDTVELLITVENENPVPLSGTTLSVDFPEGTRTADDKADTLSHYSDTLGDLPAGGKGERTVRAVLFGSEGQKVILPIRFEYRTPGSNSAFIKEETYEFTITTSPLSVSIGALSAVSAGQPFSIAVAVRSNAATPLTNAALLAEYPPGFVVTESVPAPVSGSMFDLGTVAPGEEKVVRITGRISGEDRDTRVFRFTTGTRASADATTLAVSYTTAQSSVVVEKPFLAPTLSLNRDTTGNITLSPGLPVDGVLSWVNTLATPIQDAEIRIKLSGSALDPESITTANGFYRSSDSTITFASETIPALASVGPGQTGNGSFRFATKSGAAAAALRNPTVELVISVAGRRLNERNVPMNVSSTITRTLKMETELALTSVALRTKGPFTNTGPWPPKADTETTYTVQWTLANSVNSVGGATVTATLPSYVKYTGQISPSGSNLTYNETSRTVTWNAGDVPPGTAAKTAYFQVSLLPSASQRATSPVIVNATSYSGTDRFTGNKVMGATSALTTHIDNDPAWNPGAGQVQ